MKGRILVTNYVHKHLINRLISADYLVHYLPDISYKNFQAVVSNYDGVVINTKIKMTRAVMEQGSRLKFIARLGSGLDIIDLKAAEEYGIDVYSAPEGNRNAVAEHAVGMLLSLQNNLIHAHKSVQTFAWEREINRGNELQFKTIGIIGFGHTGSSFARKWAGWEVNILAYDKYKLNYADEYPHVKEVDLAELLAQSDIISLHLPLTAETDSMVNREMLRKTKKGVIIINTSRGRIVDTHDLLKGLRNQDVGGACLDVLANEKMNALSEKEKSTYQALFAMRNVVLSPHVAGWTHESLFKIADVLADKILS